MKTDDVKSPCILVCELNANKICIGCKRTSEEISNWSKYSNKQKLEVINRIKLLSNNEDYYGGLPI